MRAGWAVPVALTLALVLLALPARLLDTDRFVTTDELFWIGRAAAFARAVQTGQYAGTFQTGHPGVTTMWTAWLGMGSDFANDLAPSRREVSRREVSQSPSFMPALAAARRGFGVVTALGIGLIGLLAWRLFGTWPAVLGGALVALDPFFLAHARLVHIDASLTLWLSLAVLAALARWSGAGWWSLLVAGLATGLALLSKAPALILVPLVPMMLVLMRGSGALRERAAWRDLVVWGVLAAVTYVAFWPAMWVAPAETLGRVLGFVRDNANPSHAAAADEDGSGALFYPLVLLLRSTPLLWLGLLGLVVARPRGLQGRAVLCLLVFALAFGAAMTLAAKNFDRYLLPIFPALNLVAGVGLWGLTVRLCSPLGPASSPNSPERGLGGGGLPLPGVAMLALVIGLGAWWIIGAWPYELTYANPLLGGNPTAHRFVASGWGEGLDQAAAYLNARPNAGRLKVALPGEIYTTVLDAQLSGTVAPAEGGNPMGYDALVVYSRNRQLGERAPFFDDSLLTWEPEHVVTLSGVDYAWIYDTRAGAPVGAQFGDRIVLDGYGLVDSSAGAGRRRFQARLRWRPLDVMAPGLQVVIELRPPGGGEPYTLTQQIQRGAVAPSGVGEWAPMSYEIVLPADAPPGSYVLAVRVLGEDGRPLPVTGQPPRPPGVPNEPDAVPLRHIEVR